MDKQEASFTQTDKRESPMNGVNQFPYPSCEKHNTKFLCLTIVLTCILNVALLRKWRPEIQSIFPQVVIKNFMQRDCFDHVVMNSWETGFTFKVGIVKKTIYC